MSCAHEQRGRVNLVAKSFLWMAGVAAALAVLLGAFGAHGLKARLAPDMMAVYQTAVQYHMWHALGLALISVVALHYPDRSALRLSSYLMLAGMIIFSGSLYLLAVTNLKMLGAITPVGGLLLIAAWLVFAWGIARE